MVLILMKAIKFSYKKKKKTKKNQKKKKKGQTTWSVYIILIFPN
jgi:hypothetical protein